AVENLGGGLVTPGLIDAHTHPVYAGNRYAELAMRAGGSSQGEIAAAGGGMASTVTVTRGTDPWTLCNGVRERLREWLRSGTTTIEAKTGYHLTRDGELADVRMLRSLENEPGMPRIHVTFYAAQMLPPSAPTASTSTARTAGSPRKRPAGSSTRAAAPGCCPGCTPAGTRTTAPAARPASRPNSAARPPTCCTPQPTRTSRHCPAAAWPPWSPRARRCSRTSGRRCGHCS